MKQYRPYKSWESCGENYFIAITREKFPVYENDGVVAYSRNEWSAIITMKPQHDLFYESVFTYEIISDRFSYDKSGKIKSRTIKFNLNESEEVADLECLSCMKYIIEDIEGVFE